MPRIVREADVRWEGNLARGAGSLTAVTSGAFSELPFSLPARVGAVEGKTSPEELLAAAHAGCFTMSLAGTLTGQETPPTRLDVRCVVTMDEVEGNGHQIVHSALVATGAVDRVDEEGFASAGQTADSECPFSTLLRNAGVDVELTTQLRDGGQ